MTRRLRPWLALLLVLVLVGCTGPAKQPAKLGRPCPVETLALAPFQAAKMTPDKQGVICPVTGELFLGEVVSDEALAELTAQLPLALEDVFSCAIVPPNRLAGYLPVEPSRPGAQVSQALGQAGRAAKAQAVLVGTAFRYRDRQGADLSVQSAASVAFGLYLIDTRTDRIVWRAMFDETQRSLSENLLKAGTFFERGGRWLTGAELARSGLRETLTRLPSQMPEE